jgi:hypothetical protein
MPARAIGEQPRDRRLAAAPTRHVQASIGPSLSSKAHSAPNGGRVVADHLTHTIVSASAMTSCPSA